MPAVIEEPVRGFSAEDFNGPGAPPDDHVQAPKGGGALSVDAPVKDAPVVKEEPDVKPLANEDDQPAQAASLTDAMNDPVDEAKKEEAEQATADKKVADEAAAVAEKLKADKLPPTPEQRDADLKVEHASHVHPNTRKRFEAVTAKAKAARDERDAAITRANELEKRAQAAEEKTKTVAIPEAAETELKTLRERVRELDITQDPIIQAKYDKRISANHESILGVLKAQGLGMMNDGAGKQVEVPGVIQGILKAGLTMKTLQPYLTKLEEAGLVDEAESIRESVRENTRLSRDKQAEIETWKGNHTTRVQERENLTKQQQEKQSAEFRVQTEAKLKTDLESLAKDFAYINQPPAPLATDIPATVKAKQAAIDEWSAAAKAIETAVKGFDTAGATPDKLPEIVGRLNAHAIQAVVLKNHVLPRVIRDLAARDARIKQLESELGAIRDAGKLSRAQGASPGTDAGNGGRPEPKTLDEAFADPTGQ